MRTIKIFALPSHQERERTHGVDFARIIQPITFLNGYKDNEAEFKTDVYDIHEEKPLDWLGVAKNYDIIYLNYINDPWGYSALGSMARGNGKKIVFDIDDALWEIKRDNPAYNVYKKGGKPLFNFTCIVNDVDYVTTTNSYLKNVISHNSNKRPEKIKVLPNYIDLSLYNHISPVKKAYDIQLTHFGSTTHFDDLLDNEFVKGIDKLLSDFPNVTLKFVGAFIPKYRMRWGSRYVNAFGHGDIYTWINDFFPEFMDETDIMIVPLTDDVYNKCKSPIKWLEASSAGKVGCWANIRQYREVIDNGKNGFLCRKAQDWYKNLKYLIENPQKRKEMGQKAYEDVKNEWRIEKNIKNYADFFKKVLE